MRELLHIPLGFDEVVLLGGEGHTDLRVYGR